MIPQNYKGRANAGKSQLAHFLRDVLGRTSCFSVNSINQLGDSRVTGALVGKLLLVCSDVPDAVLKADAVAVVKELTEGDPLHANPKYKDPIEFDSNAKLLLLSNFDIRLRQGTSDEGFSDRMLKVPFPFSVPKERQIEDIHSKLFREAGGILWKALDALLDFEDRGGVFTQVEHIELGSDSMASLPFPSNSERIGAFVRQRCILEAAAHSLISELYAEFLAFDGQEYPELERIQSPIFSRILSQ